LATISYDYMAELMTLVTGREWTAAEMDEVGERVLNIGRAFNQREGFARKGDTMRQGLRTTR
jgi:aldehyde:ferredoxin oxidoreductase